MIKLTPAMQQYVDLKQQNPDCILFFRLGDFYEVFWEDAQLCSKLLDLVLTAKNKTSDNPIPMAGMPYHSIDKYIAKLIKAGYKVAIADQMTEPKPGQIVQRAITSIITPGTYIDEKQSSENHILCISNQSYGDTTLYHLARGDFIAGEYRSYSCSTLTELHQVITLTHPREIILHKTSPFIKELAESLKTQPNTVISYRDMLDNPEQFITSMLRIQSISSFGQALADHRAIAFALLLHYLYKTQQQDISTVYRISLYRPGDYVLLDDVTIKNLELFSSSYDQDSQYSLFGILDTCQTSSGSKLLKSLLSHPLKNSDQILARQLHIAYWMDEFDEAQAISRLLGGLYDIPRLLTRLIYKVPHYQSFQRLRTTLHTLLYGGTGQGCQSELRAIDKELKIKHLTALYDRLTEILKPDDELSNNTSEYIRTGYDTSVDELRNLVHHTDQILLQYHQQLINHLDSTEVKIIFVSNQGYLIEVTPKNIKLLESKRVQGDEYFDFERRQTLKTGQRYSTPYLDQLQNELLGAKDKLAQQEFELLKELQTEVTNEYHHLAQLAEAVSYLDIYTSMGIFAKQHQYVQPTLVSQGETHIMQARHPIIEAQLGVTESFIPNDLIIHNEIHLITGPNMGGKSTFLRQHALIVLMAHCGLFVPAREATIALVDGIFARVGSGDIIAKNQSTFMTEMIEVANIINNATKHSFVIFDELGRGTSTYDGLSITRAIIEYFATQVKCNVLVATHYHELITLADSYTSIKNFHVGVYDNDHEVIFLKKVLPGGMEKSYGLEVARLAGISKQILEQAKYYLSGYTNQTQHPQHQENLFGSFIGTTSQADDKSQKILGILDNTDINTITPIQAMQVLIKIMELKS
ncbi:DNA mismatch repair protein MutS [candidate division SR1 bacterium Aalborg_AAW-1]|nr:DNA mismatch repair protein MutS [candidate division SR1 bacterium Aalborg_AAW-1]